MSPRSTLLILCESSPESHRPAGERMRHLALASRNLFERAVVLTLGNRAGATNPKAGAQVLLQPINFGRAMPFPLSAILDPVRLVMFIVHGFVAWRRFNPSLVVASMPPFETGLSAWFLARWLRLKLVIDLRDDWESAVSANLARYFPKQLLHLLFTMAREIYSFSVAIFAATQTIAETVRKRGIHTAIHLVPNGADSSLFKPRRSVDRDKIRLKYALPLEKTVILYSGSGINPYNRLDVVLSSLKMLPAEIMSKIFLVFYVYGGREDLEGQRRALALPDDLAEIRAPLARTDLAEVMAACDIGVVPFDAKPYLLCARSTKLYEYLSAGLYVIGSGPQSGELDRFLYAHSSLGSFTSPSVEGFSDAFRSALRPQTDVFDDAMRNARHSFIEANYDRQQIMTKALGTLVTPMSHEEPVDEQSLRRRS